MEILNVLLVDSKPQNIVALQGMLRNETVNIYTAGTQNEALKIIWEKDVALVLADLQMTGLDSVDFVSALQSSRKARHTMVIFITTLTADYYHLSGRFSSNAIHYIYKPFSTGSATQKISSFLQLCRSQREIQNKDIRLQMLADMVEHSPNIICTLRHDTFEIAAINPAVERLLGITALACLEKPFYELTEFGVHSGTFTRLHEVVQNNLETFAFEDSFLNSAGERILLDGNGIYANGFIYLNLYDCTLRRSEYEAIIAAKDRAEHLRETKELLIANISHEIRTPITGIIDILHLLTETKLDEKQKELIHLVSMNSETLLSLVNDVLDISKLEAGKFSIRRNEVNLHSLIKSVTNLLGLRAAKKQLQLFSEQDSNIPEYICADGLRLNQILMNLLSNAIKFTEKGYIKLTTKVLKREGNRVQLQFNVIDTGIGIAKDKLSKIFESFTQAEEDTTEKFGGTGLGLAIVKQLVALKGGQLTVDSKINKGSTFSYTNWYEVINKSNQIEGIEQKIIRFTPFSNPKVLLVEDNALNQMAIEILVKKWSVKLDHALNGIEAIEMLKKNDYELILMDTQMPEMNGYEATQAIRNGAVPGKAKIPIISVSAGVSKEEQSQALAAGMNEVIEKPVRAAELYEKMRVFLSTPANHV